MTRDGAVLVEREVRELIRRRGLDPARDPDGVRALVSAAIADYDERSVLGAVPPLDDAAAVHKHVVDAVAGLGPLQRYLDDPSVEEIWINNPHQVFVARGGVPELTTTILTDEQVRDLVEQMLRPSGRRLDLSCPFVDAQLPGGERLHVVMPDVTRADLAVNIRKHVARATSLDDLVALGTLPRQPAAFLAAAVRAGLNVLVSGGTLAGSYQGCLAVAFESHANPARCDLRPHLRDLRGVRLHRAAGRSRRAVRRCSRLAGRRHFY